MGARGYRATVRDALAWACTGIDHEPLPGSSPFGATRYQLNDGLRAHSCMGRVMSVREKEDENGEPDHGLSRTKQPSRGWE